MKNLILIAILCAIIAFSTAIYFLISHFSPQTNTQQPATVSVSPKQTEIPTQTTQISACGKNQLSGVLSAQGAAGSIYAQLVLTNVGKMACAVILGNTVTATFEANNIVLHNEQSLTAENLMLAPGEKAYSQIHYPNGPQCQSGNTPKQIIFMYKTNQTSVTFTPDQQTGKLMIQACSLENEKTTVDIWPLSKNPITP